MATDAQTWEDGIRAFFEMLSGLPTHWRDQERPFLAPDDLGQCLIKVIGERPLGVDETREVLNFDELMSSPPSEIEPSQVGLRIITLQVQIETFDQDSNRRARFRMGQITTRIRRPRSRRALRVIDTSIIDIQPAVFVENTVDEHAYSLGTMAIRFHTIVDERDKPFGRIDRIEIQPSFDAVSGERIPLPIITINLPNPQSGFLDYADALTLRSSERSYFDPATSRLIWFSANIPRILNDASIVVHGANTNRALRSEELDNASWTKVNSPTIIVDDANAPDFDDPTGAADADRVTWTTGGSPGEITQSPATPALDAIVASAFVRAASGNPSIDVRITDRDGNTATQTVMADPRWQRVFVIDTSSGGGAGSGAVALVENTDGAAFHGWGLGFVPTNFHDMPYVRTGGASTTGALEDVSMALAPMIMRVGDWEVDVMPRWSTLTQGPGLRVIYGFEGITGSRIGFSATGAVIVEIAAGTKVISGVLTFDVDQKITLSFRSSIGELTIAGATTGNGVFTGVPWAFASGPLQIGNAASPTNALAFNGRISQPREL